MTGEALTAADPSVENAERAGIFAHERNRRNTNASASRASATLSSALPHDGLRTLHPQAVLSQRFGGAGIACVADQDVEKIFIRLRYTRD